MTTGKFLGNDAAGSESGALPADYILLHRFQSSATGSLTEVKYKPRISGNIKYAIYTDSSGQPGSLLQAVNTDTAVTADVYNTLFITPINVSANSYYWLAIAAPTNQGYYYIDAATGNRRYRTITYPGFSFPNPDPGGNTSDNYNVCVAGWGIPILSISSGISQPVGHGSPKLSHILKPSIIAQTVAIGTPAVVTTSLVIHPTGIVQAAGAGTPWLIYPQVISPYGGAQPVSIGQPRIGIFGFVRTAGTFQQIFAGNPTILKYVWHVILDGRYAVDTPEVNRAYIIGRDADADNVYGTAEDSAEVGLVGERLDFRQEPAVTSAAEAAELAGAVLNRMRLGKASGVIVIPPNCGQELWDAVQIWDSAANQTAAKFRVVGIRFEYSPGQARYEHRLILGMI